MEIEQIEADGVTGLRVHGWEVTSCHRPILSNTAIEEHTAELGFNVPEMIFGDNFLRIRHSASGKELSLCALDALRMVDTGPLSAKAVQVSIARDWFESRRMRGIPVVNPFDWTFSTRYRGTSNLEFTTSSSGIDYERLKVREDILFYDENILFEDDLGDNGTSQLAYKVRVMPSGFFVLLRFFLRVDGVLFRIYDTRLYHRFGSDSVVREFSTREMPFDDVKRLLPRKEPGDEDLSLLNNIQFVDGVIGNPAVECEAASI
ncbi:Tap42 interacting protein [Coemansia sp. RSA 720]|nr:Tap42 interacting protein [Coemansia sp. RSA 638]KAJ2119520.1 Tap42 interacting protein [Coemansia sp. RSA 720]KAJ2539725.1 Tap42 interacting protein [Coemansia sp. RSA 1853]KAJ2662602.1 Tap42 interacting protein [Coemansia sp. RSA 1199]